MDRKSKIEEYKILPGTIKEILKENKIPVHKINNEFKKRNWTKRSR